MSRRTLGWWFLAQDVCARLTRPPTDVADADRQFARLLRESRLWAFGGDLIRKVRAAWLDSNLRSALQAVESEWPSSDPVQALHAVAWVMVVSGVTVLIAQALGPTELDPLSCAMPAAVALGGVVMQWVANRTTRATGREQS